MIQYLIDSLQYLIDSLQYMNDPFQYIGNVMELSIQNPNFSKQCLVFYYYLHMKRSRLSKSSDL